MVFILTIEKKKKVGRTINLESDVNDRLIALCIHLGVNPNAYLLNEIGKAISRDELTYKAAQQTQNMQDQFSNLFMQILQQEQDQEDK